MRYLILSILLMTACQLPTKNEQIDKWINFYAKKYSVQPALVTSVIRQENPKRDIRFIGGVGEIGLGQIRYEMHKDFCNLNRREDLFSIKINVRCTTKLISHLYKKHGCIRTALASYNAGEKGASLGRGRDYAQKVLNIYKNIL